KHLQNAQVRALSLAKAFAPDPIALKINLPDLILEPATALQRVVKILLLKIVGLEIIDRRDGRIARLVGEQRHLSENIARTERGNLVLCLAGLGTRDAGLAARDHEKLLAQISLADDDVAARVFALVHLVGDVCDLGRR